jgi:hypothetical protein
MRGVLDLAAYLLIVGAALACLFAHPARRTVPVERTGAPTIVAVPR